MGWSSQDLVSNLSLFFLSILSLAKLMIELTLVSVEY